MRNSLFFGIAILVWVFVVTVLRPKKLRKKSEAADERIRTRVRAMVMGRLDAVEGVEAVEWRDGILFVVIPEEDMDLRDTIEDELADFTFECRVVTTEGADATHGGGMTRDERIKKIAAMAHEVNRGYCQALGDFSQVPWVQAEDWQRHSAIQGVKLHLDNPDAGPQASHESWMAEKVATGWKYGEVKDTQAKTHPCMVPFAELPQAQQAKDYIFRSVVHAASGLFVD